MFFKTYYDALLLLGIEKRDDTYLLGALGILEPLLNKIDV